MLATIATTRQGVIRGLIQDMFIFQNVSVDEQDVSNPDITSK